jgi:Low affinity iron permease
LVINSVTNIVSMLMVFLIQNSHNRDSSAVQLKLANCSVAAGKLRTRSSIWKILPKKTCDGSATHYQPGFPGFRAWVRLTGQNDRSERRLWWPQRNIATERIARRQPGVY